jgi:hypothetical protein
MMGANFSLVTINDKFTGRIVGNVERYKLAGRMAAVNRMTIERLTELDQGFTNAKARKRILDSSSAPPMPTSRPALKS